MIITGALMAGAVVLAKNLNKKNQSSDMYQIARINLDSFRDRFCNAMVMLGSKKHQTLLDALADFCDVMIMTKGNKELFLSIQEFAKKYKWSERQIGELQCRISMVRPTDNNSLSRIMCERAYIKYAFSGDFGYVSKKGIVCETNENQTLAWLCNGRIAYPSSYEKIFGGMVSEEMFVATCKGANPALVRKYYARITNNQIFVDNYNRIIALSERIADLTNSVNMLSNLLDTVSKQIEDIILIIRKYVEAGFDDGNILMLYEGACKYARIAYDIISCQIIDDNGELVGDMATLIDQQSYEEGCDNICDNNRSGILSDNIEFDLNDFNIRIINDKKSSDYTIYSIAYKKDLQWQKININAKLCIDERLRWLSVNDMDYLLNDLDIELGIGNFNTNIYYGGNEEEYMELRNRCSEMYGNVNVIRIER